MTVLWANVVSAWRCRWCELFESSHWFVPGLFFECLWCRWCESHSVAGCISDYCWRNCVSCVGRPAIEFKAVMFVMSMGLKAHVISCEACELCHSCLLCELWQSISSSVCQAHLSCCSAVLRVIKFLSVMTVVAALETLGAQQIWCKLYLWYSLRHFSDEREIFHCSHVVSIWILPAIKLTLFTQQSWVMSFL